MKTIKELMQWRFACKHFDSKRKIKVKELKEILEATTLAPSSFGLQAWKFIAVTDKKIREKLLPACDNQEQIVNCSTLIVCCIRTDLKGKKGLIESYIEIYKKVRHKNDEQMVKFRNSLNSYLAEKNPEEQRTWLKKQLHIAIETMMMACAEKEIDTCPIEGFKEKKVSQILKLQKNIEPAILLCLGYRDMLPAKKVRFPFKEVVEIRK